MAQPVSNTGIGSMPRFRDVRVSPFILNDRYLLNEIARQRWCGGWTRTHTTVPSRDF